MTLAQRNRLRKIVVLAMLLTVGLTMAIRLRIAPVAEELVQIQVDNQASDAINAAIAEQITDGAFDYDRMVTVEKDATGRVTAVRTNVGEVNRLKTDVLQRLDTRLESLSMEHMGIPFGSILFPELFSGWGPEYPVQVLAVRTTDASFRNAFYAAGINQTLHSIYIDIHVTVTIMTWSGTSEIAVDSSVVAAETVIVGTVPNTYFGMEELP